MTDREAIEQIQHAIIDYGKAIMVLLQNTKAVNKILVDNGLAKYSDDEKSAVEAIFKPPEE